MTKRDGYPEEPNFDPLSARSSGNRKYESKLLEKKTSQQNRYLRLQDKMNN